MKSKKAISTFFITSVITIVVFFTIMFIFDPLQLFHKHWINANQNKLVTNMRQQAAGIINQYEFDSIILGTSQLENTSSKEASKQLGGKFVNLSIEGGDFHTRSFILQYALEKKNIKQILYSLDNNGLIFSQKLQTNNFDYLYDNNHWNDFTAYTNSKYLFCLIDSASCFGTDIELDRPNAWYKKKSSSERFGGLENWFKYRGTIETAMERDVRNVLEVSMNVKNNDIIDTKNIGANILINKKYIDDYLLYYVRKYPKTDFILVLPPYSRLSDAMLAQYNKDGFSLNKKIIKYLVLESTSYNNLKLFGWGNYSFVDNIANYRDPFHYEYKINSWMLQAIRKDEGRLNHLNVDAYLDVITKKALEFDLIGFGDQIDIFLNANTRHK